MDSAGLLSAMSFCLSGMNENHKRYEHKTERCMATLQTPDFTVTNSRYIYVYISRPQYCI